MNPKFSSKEFRFLKPGSEEAVLRPPRTYFSDLIHSGNVPFETFARRLDSAEIPAPAFCCAAIRVKGEATEATQNLAGDIFEACFHSVLDKKRGIWEILSPTACVLAFWDFDDTKKAKQLLDTLMQNMSNTLNADLIMGVSMFPFHEFSRPETVGSALKALDHAAFFGAGKRQQFDAVSLNISGDRLYQLGKYDDAMAEYEKGLELEPMNINLINSLGVCHGVSEDLEKAREAFEQAIAISPKEIMVVYNLGLIHQIQGDMDKAILYMRKAHGIDDTIFEVELLLGHLLFKENRYEQALPHLAAAARINPESGLAFRIQGEIYLDRQAPDKAGAAFNSAVKLNPNDPTALSGYAVAMVRRNRNLKIALNFAKKSVELEPDNPVFRNRLDEVLEILEADAQTPKKTIKSA